MPTISKDWWFDLFPLHPTPSQQRGHPCGQHQMITIIAYDITCPKRLAKVARHCEDYGIRIQYSLFECLLPAHQFQHFWQEILQLIDPTTDSLIAYTLCANCAKKILTAGTCPNPTRTLTYVY